MVWNALPDSIRDTALSTCSFRRNLKTHFLLLLAHQRIRGFACMRYINPRLIDWLIDKLYEWQGTTYSLQKINSRSTRLPTNGGFAAVKSRSIKTKWNSQINTKYVTSHAAGENSIKINIKHTLWGTEAPKTRSLEFTNSKSIHSKPPMRT